MITYNFSEKGNLTLYEFLYQKIKQDITEGQLSANEKLPSKRNLASHLNISVITVENAYAQLMVEGYIYAKEKTGYFVSSIEHNPITIQPKLSPLPQLPSRPAYFADFHSNTISFDNFPFSIWSKLMREVLSQKDKQLLHSVPFNGLSSLRIAIADYLYHFRGMSVSPHQIIIGAGTEYLYGLLIQLIGRNHVFAVEDPGYQRISQIYKSHDVACRYISLDGEGIPLTELTHKDVDVVHISPSHHFPTGTVMPIKRRQELLNWAVESNNRYIIEDDYDSEFRFTGRPIQTIQSIDTHERVIYMNTFSKSLAPSIRISYMILPAHLMERYQASLGFYSCTVSSFEQHTLANFIARGYFEQHINRMRSFYKTQRNHIIQAIQESFPSNSYHIKEENAGLHFLLEIKTNMEDRELVSAAEKQGIRISCLSEYYHDKTNTRQQVLVINYSGIDADKVKEAVTRLSAVITSTSLA